MTQKQFQKLNYFFAILKENLKDVVGKNVQENLYIVSVCFDSVNIDIFCFKKFLMIMQKRFHKILLNSRQLRETLIFC